MQSARIEEMKVAGCENQLYLTYKFTCLWVNKVGVYSNTFKIIASYLPPVLLACKRMARSL